jgi:hypothetical protein
MARRKFPVPHEQRNIEKLLLQLAKKHPKSAKPAPIADAQPATPKLIEAKKLQ